jgi:hypothetical protein
MTCLTLEEDQAEGSSAAEMVTSRLAFLNEHGVDGRVTAPYASTENRVTP